MSWRSLDGIGSLSRPIDNSRLVREVDPRSSRRLWSLLCLIGALVGGVVLYAWPQIEAFQTGIETLALHRERERLVEINLKLRLEKASLENLQRIEAISTRELGMIAPRPEDVVIVRVEQSPGGTQMVSALESVKASRN
ncbi:MAG: cell division protein FtsL [Vicinamibacteria bacterium]|nr:cell division protein FtsL [Vicinamibacteria bacterium]